MYNRKWDACGKHGSMTMRACPLQTAAKDSEKDQSHGPVHLDGQNLGDEAQVVEGAAALGVPHAEAAGRGARLVTCVHVLVVGSEGSG